MKESLLMRLIGVGRRFFNSECGMRNYFGGFTKFWRKKQLGGRVCGRAKLLRRDASLPATQLPYYPFLLE